MTPVEPRPLGTAFHFHKSFYASKSCSPGTIEQEEGDAWLKLNNSGLDILDRAAISPIYQYRSLQSSDSTRTGLNAMSLDAHKRLQQSILNASSK